MKILTLTALLIAGVLNAADSGASAFSITIDARQDTFYQGLAGAENGFLFIPHSSFLPRNGPEPNDDADLSVKIWLAWDDRYFYCYAEVTDDKIRANNRTRYYNDCVELHFDPDPRQKATAGIVAARITALDTASAKAKEGVDNLYFDGNLPKTVFSPSNYARRQTPGGYVVEFRLDWAWIKTKDRSVPVGIGNIFGLAINVHDNDSNRRNGSIQWSAGMADEAWFTTQILGTAEFLADHKLKLTPINSIDPSVEKGKTYLSKARLVSAPDEWIELENWKFHAGDDRKWADPSYDDGSWETTYPRLAPDQQEGVGWKNIGWFRLHLSVDSTLWRQPLGLDLRQSGASEVFLDGKLLYKFGTVGRSKTEEKTYTDIYPRYVLFDQTPDHLLAVRYSNFDTDRLKKWQIEAGFFMSIIRDLNVVIADRAQVIRRVTVYQIVFTTVPLALSLLHFLLFIFSPSAKQQLYYSLCMVGWSFISYASLQNPFMNSIMQVMWVNRINTLAIAVAMIFGLLTVYAGTFKKLPRQYLPFTVMVVGAAIWGFFQPASRLVGYLLYSAIGLETLEIFRVFLMPGKLGKENRWIVGTGASILMLSVVYQILNNLGMVPPIGAFGIVYIYGVFILSITVSIDLSRNFAMTQKNLETQLVQIKDLSEKNLEQERLAKQEEIARRLLEADNARKTHELEEARSLQLSMLPKEIPQHADLTIAAYMKTASEVGGDYFDFRMTADGKLIVAIGDATGHGMKAGTMVTTIKGLFSALASDMEIEEFFGKCTSVIRGMRLGNLYMALMLVRIFKNKMTVVSAGMPPILIYRQDDKRVDELVVKGMPLGGSLPFDYRPAETLLAQGDTVLLMSDGFPELFNEHKETLDFSRAKKIFAGIAGDTPEAIISHLNESADEWRSGHPQIDDMTFIVLKVKSNGSAGTSKLIKEIG